MNKPLVFHAVDGSHADVRREPIQGLEVKGDAPAADISTVKGVYKS